MIISYIGGRKFVD